jgi:isocitrate lyase
MSAPACRVTSTHPAASGGGGILNVQRTVRQLINVGAKGCFLEDQAWPKKAGGGRTKAVTSMEEFAAKVGLQCIRTVYVCVCLSGHVV